MNHFGSHWQWNVLEDLLNIKPSWKQVRGITILSFWNNVHNIVTACSFTSPFVCKWVHTQIWMWNFVKNTTTTKTTKNEWIIQACNCGNSSCWNSFVHTNIICTCRIIVCICKKYFQLWGFRKSEMDIQISRLSMWHWSYKPQADELKAQI